jgi:hypothetical protein
MNRPALPMRCITLACLAATAAAAAGIAPVRADHAPAIVIPGRPTVPVIINGRDASYAVVEGDWGLYRAGAVSPTVIYNPFLAPHPIYGPPPAHYFPRTGQKPRVGRLEKVPPANRPLPQPAESFHREWGVQSQPGPVTEYPPFDPPPVILAPQELHRGGPVPHVPPVRRP